MASRNISALRTCNTLKTLLKNAPQYSTSTSTGREEKPIKQESKIDQGTGKNHHVSFDDLVHKHSDIKVWDKKLMDGVMPERSQRDEKEPTLEEKQEEKIKTPMNKNLQEEKREKLAKGNVGTGEKNQKDPKQDDLVHQTEMKAGPKESTGK